MMRESSTYEIYDISDWSIMILPTDIVTTFSIQLPGKDIFNIPGYRIQLAQELLHFCVHDLSLG